MSSSAIFDFCRFNGLELEEAAVCNRLFGEHVLVVTGSIGDSTPVNKVEAEVSFATSPNVTYTTHNHRILVGRVTRQTIIYVSWWDQGGISETSKF